MADDAPVALVTGSSSGFGLLSSVELARRGHRVFATMRDPSRRGRLDEAAAAAGVAAAVEVVALDVKRPESIRTAVADVERRAGRIDVLVNNAGYGLGGFLEDVEMDELREQLETNFFGLVAVTKAVIPGMRERRRGRVINVSSIAGRIGNPAFSAYCASKWAVEGLSECLRLELLPYGVYVVLVEPGTYKTDIFDRNARVARRARDPSSPWYEATQRMEKLVRRILDRSTQDPNEVAQVIAHAATTRRPRLRYLVGRDAKGEALAKALLPHGVFERVVLRYIGAHG